MSRMDTLGRVHHHPTRSPRKVPLWGRALTHPTPPDQVTLEGCSNPVTWEGFPVSEIRSFLSIFLTSNSFFPQTLILLTHVLTFTMISPHVLFPLFHFIFTIHTKSEPLQTPAKLIRRSIEDRSYLLVRLFARHLLPPDTIS